MVLVSQSCCRRVKKGGKREKKKKWARTFGNLFSDKEVPVDHCIEKKRDGGKITGLSLKKNEYKRPWELDRFLLLKGVGILVVHLPDGNPDTNRWEMGKRMTEVD